MEYIKFKIMKTHWYLIVFFIRFHTKMIHFHHNRADACFDKQKRVYEKIDTYF